MTEDQTRNRKTAFERCIKCLKLSAKAKHNSIKIYIFTSP
ncbi:hypothetical protein SEHO0A_02444 [Salmonella enterica subsp. houtenae str. ATCC BAA-1581]|nr:hypothetical protein SEHO0A_02444 [Salmonella enterica subsp. houtenae str. ATCC BAA-1581]ENZ86198.1 hypothetical protein D088_950127 [Salmonella enterica subsp. houtenae serovar 16:z4,z32:-- str. RKS3027]